MNQNKKNSESGFLQLIFLIVVALLLMKYFNLTISGIMAYFHLTGADILAFIKSVIDWFKNLVESVK